MARLKIEDLKESVDLDREAMQAISGGFNIDGPLTKQTSDGLNQSSVVFHPAYQGSGGTYYQTPYKQSPFRTKLGLFTSPFTD